MKTAIAHSEHQDCREAGADLGAQIRSALDGDAPDALILFASPRPDYSPLLEALHFACAPRALVGCSSAGEFTSQSLRNNSVCAIALSASEMRFTACLGRGLSQSPAAAASELISSFAGLDSTEYAYRSAMVLTDALAGHADELIQQMTLLTAGSYQLFGGGAGDNADFRRTHVFCGREIVPDAVVTLEILSNKPVGIGVCHGWVPASAPLRVTAAEGKRLMSLNATPVLEVFDEHAETTGQQFVASDPVPFFLHNVLGVRAGNAYKLRVPLSVEADGSVICAADIPQGSTVCIMKATSSSAAQAATQAAQAAIEQLAGHSPKVAIFFDCVATRLRTGREFGFELSELQKALGSAQFVGCNTYGQIARAEGQFEGFHNCTATIGVFSE